MHNEILGGRDPLAQRGVDMRSSMWGSKVSRVTPPTYSVFKWGPKVFYPTNLQCFYVGAQGILPHHRSTVFEGSSSLWPKVFRFTEIPLIIPSPCPCFLWIALGSPFPPPAFVSWNIRETTIPKNVTTRNFRDSQAHQVSLSNIA